MVHVLAPIRTKKVNKKSLKQIEKAEKTKEKIKKNEMQRQLYTDKYKVSK